MGRYETPDYKVVAGEDEFEIREYDTFYVVEYDNEDDPGIQGGFGALFRYISSDNRENRKISMTVPVIEEVMPDRLKMAFVVPGEFKDRIPKPSNRNLDIRRFDGGLFAAIRYSGFSNEQKEDMMKKRLSAWVSEKGYEETSNYMLAFYNAPFTLPMIRRNEILVRVVKP